MALAGLGMLRSYLTRNVVRLLLVASLVPIVISANRGLWVGLGVGLVYAAVRVALRGNARALVAILAFLAVIAALVTFTPLERYVSDRLAHQHSNERRESLSSQALRGALERPLLGYGGPRESPDLVNAPRSAPTARSTWSSSPGASPAWPSSSAGGCGPCGSRTGGPPGRPCGAT